VWALVLPVIIIGGLKSGIFTPTEAAVVAAFYALFVGFVVYRELQPARALQRAAARGRQDLGRGDVPGGRGAWSRPG
jgi:TRAP-type C4-dicarboxylate transport system permease large subunit